MYANGRIKDSDDWAENILLCKNKGKKPVHEQQLFLKAVSERYTGKS